MGRGGQMRRERAGRSPAARWVALTKQTRTTNPARPTLAPPARLYGWSAPRPNPRATSTPRSASSTPSRSSSM